MNEEFDFTPQSKHRKSSLAQSLRAVKAGGTIFVIGILDGISSEVPTFPLLMKQAVLRGISVGPRRALEEIVSSVAEELEKDVRSEGKHRDRERVEEHFRIGESRFMPQP